MPSPPPRSRARVTSSLYSTPEGGRSSPAGSRRQDPRRASTASGPGSCRWRENLAWSATVPCATVGRSPVLGSYRLMGHLSTGYRRWGTLSLPTSTPWAPNSSSPSTSANQTPRFVATSIRGAVLERGWFAPAPDGGKGSPRRYGDRRLVPPPALERGDLAWRARESLRPLPGDRGPGRDLRPHRGPPSPRRAAHHHHRRKARVPQTRARQRPDRHRARRLSPRQPRAPRGAPEQRGGPRALRVAGLFEDGTPAPLLRGRGRVAHDPGPRRDSSLERLRSSRSLRASSRRRRSSSGGSKGFNSNDAGTRQARKETKMPPAIRGSTGPLNT